MIALFFLFGSLLLGVGIVRKLLPFADGPERMFWGMTVGVMISTWAGYLISRMLLDVNVAAMLVLTIVIWIVAVLIDKTAVTSVLSSRLTGAFREHKYLFLLLLLFVPFFAYYLFGGMFSEQSSGMYLNATAWYDAALHLAISNSFAFGQNIPPMYLVIPNEPLRYPFLPDFHAAVFLKLGSSIWASFEITKRSLRMRPSRYIGLRNKCSWVGVSDRNLVRASGQYFGLCRPNLLTSQ